MNTAAHERRPPPRRDAHDAAVPKRRGAGPQAAGPARGARVKLATTPAHPGNALWQRDLSLSHERVGEILLVRDDLAGALREFRLSLEISERLARQDPGNAGWQRDLMVSYAMLAGATEPTDTAAAQVWWRKAFVQLDGMRRRGIMNPSDQNALDFLRDNVKRAE